MLLSFALIDRDISALIPHLRGEKRRLRVEIEERYRETLREMAKFDPWPVFFKREWKRNWPFLVGFAITGTIITKFTLGLTEEDAKNSPYMQKRNG